MNDMKQSIAVNFDFDYIFRKSLTSVRKSIGNFTFSPLEKHIENNIEYKIIHNFWTYITDSSNLYELKRNIGTHFLEWIKNE